MEKLIRYFNETLGQNVRPVPFTEKENGPLPYYLPYLYFLYHTTLFGHDLIFLELKNKLESIKKIETHIQILNKKLGKIIVLISEQIHPFQRKRLIEKGINFIIPGVHLYLPSLLIVFKEKYAKPKESKSTLYPSAQCILLHHFLNKEIVIESLSLKEIAEKFNYTPMAITKAVENILQLHICEVTGTKEKHVRFKNEKAELWEKALPYMVNPVLKRVYADEKPKNVKLKSYYTALPDYSDMNPGKQNYYAIDRVNFLLLEKKNQIKNLNDFEGEYCIEVWKYNPAILITKKVFNNGSVDPLSLYLSLMDDKDERTLDALEGIINKYIL